MRPTLLSALIASAVLLGVQAANGMDRKEPVPRGTLTCESTELLSCQEVEPGAYVATFAGGPTLRIAVGIQGLSIVVSKLQEERERLLAGGTRGVSDATDRAAALGRQIAATRAEIGRLVGRNEYSTELVISNVRVAPVVAATATETYTAVDFSTSTGTIYCDHHWDFMFYLGATCYGTYARTRIYNCTAPLSIFEEAHAFGDHGNDRPCDLTTTASGYATELPLISSGICHGPYNTYAGVYDLIGGSAYSTGVCCPNDGVNFYCAFF